MSIGKDSSETVKFLTLFQKLKEWIDDDPTDLMCLAKSDSSIRSLCSEVHNAAFFIEYGERQYPQLYANPVDPNFVLKWRDFEERFRQILSEIEFDFLFADFDLPPSETGPHTDPSWKFASDTAYLKTSAIKTALDFAFEQADDELHDFPEGFSDTVEEGVKAWDALQKQCGFDATSVFRRRALIPFVLIPRHISAKLDPTKKIGLIANLKQAHDAFIFGADLAAVGLMRSIMELTLKDFYHAPGNSLDERINGARRLPPYANRAALHRLRIFANKILHPDLHAREHSLSESMEPTILEREIIILLTVLRSLIEVPRNAVSARSRKQISRLTPPPRPSQARSLQSPPQPPAPAPHRPPSLPAPWLLFSPVSRGCVPRAPARSSL